MKIGIIIFKWKDKKKKKISTICSLTSIGEVVERKMFCSMLSCRGNVVGLKQCAIFYRG